VVVSLKALTATMSGGGFARRLRSLVAMYALHGLNLLVPMITLPVLARQLGPQQYGGYGVMQTCINFGLIPIEFGMGLWATKKIAGTDDQTSQRMFGRTLVYQAMNASLTLPLLAVATQFSMRPAPDLATTVWVLLSAWFYGSSTIWYHVARASVTKLLPATVAAKLICLVLVVGLLPLHPMLSTAVLGYMASWLWVPIDAWGARASVIEALRTFEWRDWLKTQREGLSIPMQRLGGGLYGLLPAMLAAAFFDLRIAGFFVLADRIVRAVLGMFQPLTQQLLPLVIENRRLPSDAPGRRRLRNYMAAVIGGSFVATALIWMTAGPLVRLVGGRAFDPSATLLRWLSPLIALITMNMVIGTLLYARDRTAVLARAVWVCGIIFSVVIFYFGDRSPAFFAACCMLVEAGVLVWFALALRAAVAEQATGSADDQPPIER
jgi:PST family polysaccharide transporter